MNRLVAIMTPVLIVALVLASTWLIPVMAIPTNDAPTGVGQTSLTCPAFTEPSSSTSTAFVPGTDTTVTGLGGTPTKVTENSVGVATSAVPLKITAPSTSGLGGVSYAASAQGASRGIMLGACRTPSTQTWLTGLVSGEDALTELILTNPDHDEAVVDLTFFGQDGETTSPGSRGIVISPASRTTVSLKPLISQDQPFSVLVTASQGRVATVARETSWKSATVVGVDWIMPATADTSIVIPGVPAGAGTRELVVTNPGERSVAATITALTSEGPVSLSGAETLVIPPQSTRSLPIQQGLAEQVSGVRITADTEISAAVRITSTSVGEKSDIAVATAATALPSTVSIPLVTGAKARRTLTLTNPDEQDAAATVTFTDAAGKQLSAAESTVVAGGSTEIVIPSGATAQAVVTTTTGTVYSAVIVTETLGSVQGVGVVSWVGAPEIVNPDLTNDPHVNT